MPRPLTFPPGDTTHMKFNLGNILKAIGTGTVVANKLGLPVPDIQGAIAAIHANPALVEQIPGDAAANADILLAAQISSLEKIVHDQAATIKGLQDFVKKFKK